MGKAISLSADLSNLQLQKIFQRTNPTVRILMSQRLGGPMRSPTYAFVVADSSGDYSVLSTKLVQVGLMAHDYAVKGKIMLHEQGLQTLYDAERAIENLKHSKTSLSSPPPLSSAIFNLNEFGIEPSPLLDSALAEWMQEQTIAPMRYAVYNQPRNEIEISFVDPSAHNDSEHQLKIKDAIGTELRRVFEQKHVAQPDADDLPSGRYTRRPTNNRIHNMSLIRLNIDEDVFSSDSAARAPSYKFARVSGKAELVLPSSKRAGLTEIKTHLKRAKSDRTKALRLTASHAAVMKQVEGASTPERKKTLRAKAKVIKGQVSALNKSAKAALTAANKSARTHKLTGLKLGLNATVMASAKKLATAKVDVFGADGKRGQFKPRFAPDAKFHALGGGTSKKPSHAEAVKRSKARIADAKARGETTKPKHVAVRKGEHAVGARPTKNTRTKGFTKKMRPGAAAKIAQMQKDFAAEERQQMKALRTATGAPIKKSDFKGANYAVHKNGSMVIVTKDDKRYDLSAADIKKHGVDVDTITDMLTNADARQRSSIVALGGKK